VIDVQITYPLYEFRKSLRDNGYPHIVVLLVLIGVLLATILMCGTGAGAVMVGATWVVAKLMLDKHPSDVNREQFEKLSEDLKVVSLALYARVEEGSDGGGTPESEAFYTAYSRAMEAERGDDLGEFWEAVRQSENALRDWNRC